MAAKPPTTLLTGHYETGEPRCLGHGRYGPIIRARDIRTHELVAVKVYNAAEAFHSGRLTDCATIRDAEAEALLQFQHEVRLMKRAAGGKPAAGAADAPWLAELPDCSAAVVKMLDHSKDARGEPSRADDGCCYLVMELGLFTMEQLVRDSREVGRRPSVPEVRETARSLLAMLTELHRCGCVLASHSPRHFMRFPSGWKVLAADALRPAATVVEAGGHRAEPLYLAPEFASALLWQQVRLAPPRPCTLQLQPP